MSQFLLSIAIIAKNEESNLPELFYSLENLRRNINLQTVVVDTGSTDTTVQIAEKFGADVYHEVWEKDFSKARNLSLSKCVAPWILWLDADDILSEDASKWLSENIEKNFLNKVYSFTISSNLEGGEENSFSQIRLIPNNLGLRFQNPIHESLTESIVEQNLTGIFTGLVINHTGYANNSVVKEKNLRNKKVLIELVAKGSKKLSVLFSLARTWQVEQHYTKALELFHKILSMADARSSQSDIYTASLIYTGQILGFQNKLQDAEDFFQKYLESCNENPQYLFEMGKILYVRNKKLEAVKFFQDCLELRGFSWTIPTSWNVIYTGARELLKRIESEQSPPAKPSTEIDVTRLQKMFSICTILKNEESNISFLCDNLPLDNIEWITVDTGSTDRTEQVLHSRGITPHHFDWCDDFSMARNYSLKKATRPWILWLDADDRLNPDFWKKLKTVLDFPQIHSKKKAAYRCIIKSERENEFSSPPSRFEDIVNE